MESFLFFISSKKNFLNSFTSKRRFEPKTLFSWFNFDFLTLFITLNSSDTSHPSTCRLVEGLN